VVENVNDKVWMDGCMCVCVLKMIAMTFFCDSMLGF
jgi:hypothetical protein